MTDGSAVRQRKYQVERRSSRRSMRAATSALARMLVDVVAQDQDALTHARRRVEQEVLQRNHTVVMAERRAQEPLVVAKAITGKRARQPPTSPIGRRTTVRLLPGAATHPRMIRRIPSNSIR